MNLVIFAFKLIINPFPKIDYTRKLITPKENTTRIKILANINFQYLDESTNTRLFDNKEKNNEEKKEEDKEENKEEEDKKEEYSPLFSHKKFQKVVNIDKFIEKFKKYPQSKKREKIQEKKKRQMLREKILLKKESLRFAFKTAELKQNTKT